MFKIDTEFKIHCSRGDVGNVTLKIPYTDNNGYIKYYEMDGLTEVDYWYDTLKKIMYDSSYEKSTKTPSDLTMALYQFQVGDKVKFNIYEKKGYDVEPLLSKEVTISTASDECIINLTESDTTFGEISNKPVTYWYDITLNEDMTIVCYNEDGAMEFIQYPAKSGDDE